MVNLVIMRHGEAQALLTTDRARELTEQGQHEVNQMASWLEQHYGVFDWIWTSPFCRTKQTAELMLAKQEGVSQLECVPELTPDADPSQLKLYLDARLSQKTDAKVLLISHMPLVSFLVGAFSAQNEMPVFDTAQLVCIDYTPKNKGVVVDSMSPSEVMSA